MGWMLNPFLFLFLFPSARGPKFSGSASHIARRKKWQPVAKVGRDQMHLVPMILEGTRPTGRSHVAVAPMFERKYLGMPRVIAGGRHLQPWPLGGRSDADSGYQ